MMRVVALVLVSLLVCGIALASDSAKGNYTNGLITKYINSSPYGLDHTHNYSQTSSYKAPLGVGVDLTLYEMDVAGVGLGVGVDTEYDLNNGVWGAMGKVKVNTTNIINKLLGK
jgi:hypothetical protein